MRASSKIPFRPKARIGPTRWGLAVDGQVMTLMVRGAGAANGRVNSVRRRRRGDRELLASGAGEPDRRRMKPALDHVTRSRTRWATRAASDSGRTASLDGASAVDPRVTTWQRAAIRARIRRHQRTMSLPGTPPPMTRAAVLDKRAKLRTLASTRMRIECRIARLGVVSSVSDLVPVLPPVRVGVGHAPHRRPSRTHAAASGSNVDGDEMARHG